MENQWSLETRGDPLGKLCEFITHVWQSANLDGMLVTTNNGDKAKAIPRYLTEPTSITQINPFMPLMEINAARMVPRILTDHPGKKVGALLRPCEMRALIEMTKHTPIKTDDLLTISVDCLGTLPADEYQWRLERTSKTSPKQAKDPDDLAQEALKFARQGGIIPYRYRTACQICSSPAAEAADINFHVLGLPVRQQIMVSVTNVRVAETIHLEDLVSGKIDPDLALQHERVLSRMCERHQRTMERLNAGLGDLLPADVDGFIHQLENCGDCQKCLDVCPICSVDRPARSSDGHYDRTGVMRWLVSCAGCGMCEQSCPNHLPTSAIFAHIRQLLDQEWAYVPGRSMSDSLPVL